MKKKNKTQQFSAFLIPLILLAGLPGCSPPDSKKNPSQHATLQRCSFDHVSPETNQMTSIETEHKSVFQLKNNAKYSEPYYRGAADKLNIECWNEIYHKTSHPQVFNVSLNPRLTIEINNYEGPGLYTGVSFRLGWDEPRHDYIASHQPNCKTNIEKDGSGTFQCTELYDGMGNPKTAHVINGKFKISFGDAPSDEK